jgi:hypothetical protein
MDDLVIFYKDLILAGDHKNTVFKRGKEYKILSEDDHSIYVNSKPGTNECSQIPKRDEGVLFEYKK